MIKNQKKWKTIYPEKMNVNRYLSKLKKNKIILSPWIENIYKSKKNNIKFTNQKLTFIEIN